MGGLEDNDVNKQVESDNINDKIAKYDKKIRRSKKIAWIGAALAVISFGVPDAGHYIVRAFNKTPAVVKYEEVSKSISSLENDKAFFELGTRDISKLFSNEFKGSHPELADILNTHQKNTEVIDSYLGKVIEEKENLKKDMEQIPEIKRYFSKQASVRKYLSYWFMGTLLGVWLMSGANMYRHFVTKKQEEVERNFRYNQIFEILDGKEPQKITFHNI